MVTLSANRYLILPHIGFSPDLISFGVPMCERQSRDISQRLPARRSQENIREL